MDFYSDDSDPDIDSDLREDLDALRRSCVLSGADPDAAVAQVSSCLAAAGPSTPSAPASAPAKVANYLSDDDDDDDDDLAFVRIIRASLNLNNVFLNICRNNTVARQESELPIQQGGAAALDKPAARKTSPPSSRRHLALS